MKKILLIFFLVLIIAEKSGAQRYTDLHIDNYSTEYVKVQRGLSQNSILCMIEDKNGFLWTGTWDGLNRFDGYDFVIFQPDPAAAHSSVSNATVNSLLKDSRGNIWVGTDEGLNMFDPDSLYFHHFLQDSDSEINGGENRILALAEGNPGEIWTGTANGLYVFNKTKGEFRFIPFPGNKLIKRQLTVFSLLHSSKSDVMWVGTNVGLFRFDLATMKYVDFTNQFPSPLQQIPINALFEDSRGNIWIGSQNGLYKYIVSETGNHLTEFSSVLPVMLPVLSFMEDNTGIIWIGTLGNGIRLYNYDTGRFENFGNPEQLHGGLSNNYIYSMLQTTNGTIWIGTWRGLNKFTPTQFRFTHIPSGQGNTYLNSNMIWSFIEINPDVVWVGTESGINVYSRNTGRLNYMTMSSQLNIRLPSDKIRAMFRDSQGIFWVGTFDKGLVRFDPETGKNTFFNTESNNPDNRLAGNSVWKIIEDKQDKSIWFATNGGVTRIFRNNLVRHYKHVPGDTTTISNDEIYWIFSDKSNAIWISSFSGVNIYDRENDRFSRFGKNKSGNNILKTNRILSVFEDSSGNIWFATMGKGVNIYNPVTREMKYITEREGLANNTVYNIIEDNQGNFWLTTNQGISKINTNNFSIWNFDVRDGVQGHEFNLGASALLSSGEIMFGGMNGLNIFHPDQLRENIYNPRIFITKFSIYNKKRFDFLNDKSIIELKWRENYFSLEFATLDYSNPKKINYAYKLEGFDNSWSYVPSDKRYAEYTNIPPGHYVFRVRGTNSDGLWSTNELTVTIIIHAPFWKTLWFKILSALILTFLIWYIVNSQISKFRKKQEIERKIFEFEKNVFELEQKVLHLQMNPHFLFNALNSIQSFIVKNETESAVKYLSKFSNLMRLILLTSKTSNVTVSDEVRLLEYYLDIERLRFDFRFTFHIQVDPSIDDEFTAIPSHMVQPLVENSIKHGLLHKKGEGHVGITFRQYDDYLEIVVEDNGVGRQNAKEIQRRKKLETSNQGIGITQERLGILNRQFAKNVFGLEYSDLLDEHSAVCGTRAILKVPCMDA